MSGKGDKYRPVDRQRWDEGYDRIFRKRARERAALDEMTRMAQEDGHYGEAAAREG